MEDVSNGILGVMETMTAETIAMKENAQVRHQSVTYDNIYQKLIKLSLFN